MSAEQDDSGQGKSPEQLREEIEATRQELGDTVEALAEKADVKAQTKDRISAVKQTAEQRKDDFVSKAKSAAPDSASSGAQQVASTLHDRPVPFTAAAAFAVGLVVGWLLGHN